MTDYPVRDEPFYDEGNLPMQVYDDQKSDQIKPLILVKVNWTGLVRIFLPFSPPGLFSRPSSGLVPEIDHLGTLSAKVRPPSVGKLVANIIF